MRRVPFVAPRPASRDPFALNACLTVETAHPRIMAIRPGDNPGRSSASRRTRSPAKEPLPEPAAPQVITETVLVAKEYLDAELAKCETWEALNIPIKCLFDTDFDFRNVKGKGVGQTTILKFLGGNWKQWLVVKPAFEWVLG